MDCNGWKKVARYVYAADSLFQQEETEAILLVDTSNVFNSLNHLSALHNIVDSVCHLLQPSSTPTGCQPNYLLMVICYTPVKVPLKGIAMPMYALATIPLIKKLDCHLGDVSQVWYADDASAVGKIDRLCEWWSQLASQGPKFGYFASATKTWLVTKEKHLTTATDFFANTGVQVTSEGRPYLDAVIGTEEFVISHVKDRVAK